MLLAVLLVGCSDEGSDNDGDADRERPDRATVERGLAALYAGDHAATRDEEAGVCFATELVDRAGLGALQDAGIVTDDGQVARELPTFDPTTAELWVEAQFACVDYVEESTRAVLAQSKGRIDRTRYADCLRAALTEAEMRDAVAASLTGSWDAPEVTALADAQQRCQRRAGAG